MHVSSEILMGIILLGLIISSHYYQLIIDITKIILLVNVKTKKGSENLHLPYFYNPTQIETIIVSLIVDYRLISGSR